MPWLKGALRRRVPSAFFESVTTGGGDVPPAPVLLDHVHMEVVACVIQDRIGERCVELPNHFLFVGLPSDGEALGRQVRHLAGPNCGRLRAVAPTVDGAHVEYHPALCLPVCYIVHDCLWQGLLPDGDHRVYLVRGEAADQRMAEFIGHVLRSPLRWYFKCLVLEALCREAVGLGNPLRQRPTSDELVVVFALLDRFGRWAARYAARVVQQCACVLLFVIHAALLWL